MKGSELIRKIEKVAKKRNLSIEFKPRRGKGSHGTLVVGERFAIIPDAKKELKTGTMSAILKQLGIDRGEIDRSPPHQVRNMFIFEYSAILARDEEGGFVVTFPDFPEAVAQGETEQDALEEGTDSIEEAVANRIAMNLDLPEPSTARGAYSVAVPASTALKAALYLAIRGLNMNKLQLAALLGVDEKEVRRLLSPYHPSKLNRIEELMKRLGRRVVIGLQAPPAAVKPAPVRQPEGATVWESAKRAPKNLYVMPAKLEHSRSLEPAPPDEVAS